VKSEIGLVLGVEYEDDDEDDRLHAVALRRAEGRDA
jgi:hypothetical protein